MLRLPEYFGFVAWSPFLVPEIALQMLTLPDARRKSRLWQQDLFRSYNLDLESIELKFEKQNNLNHQAMRRMHVKPLEIALLREVMQPSYIEWINSQVSQQGRFWDVFWKIHKIPKLGGALRRVGVQERRLEAYCAYLTLKPIENLLRRRRNSNSHLKSI